MPPSKPERLNFERQAVTELDKTITDLEVIEALRHASNGKAPRCDRVTNEFWKNLPALGVAKLTEEFNEVFEKGEIPEDWKISKTVMIHKKGDQLNLMNYRPIALANTQMKLFTYIIAKRLGKWATRISITYFNNHYNPFCDRP